MAGSLSHIVDDDTGRFTMDLLDNMGDAHEALEECFALIHALTGGDKEVINNRCRELGFPAIKTNMVAPASRLPPTGPGDPNG
jgi:hypothetical protein